MEMLVLSIQQANFFGAISRLVSSEQGSHVDGGDGA
jgi:hypothetical protein